MRTVSRRAAASLVLGGLLSCAIPTPLAAQSTPPAALRLGDVTISGSLRTRVESSDWFGDSSNGTYTYPGSVIRIGLAESKRTFDWQLELALPFLLGLPTDASPPAPQGALGLGANYYAANGNRTNAAMLFVKQATVRFKGLGGIAGQSLRVGRLEFIDGAEVAPKQATLAALKRDRLAHRLLGTFGFTHVGRSFDGVQYVWDAKALNVTALAARPTRGVFDVDGWGELNVNVFYGAVTRRVGADAGGGEWRVFGLGYQDYRDSVVKVDNRLLAARRADRAHINVATLGGHDVQAVDTPAGRFDLLVWGAAQVGAWGNLTHRAGAFAAEVGWQPRALPALAPWVRAGYDYGTGDGDANDATHGTFFQILPTPRVYARFPFFNLMNIADAFGELIVRPSKDVTLRADVHALRLARASDLWYQGGGAFQADTFGYAGRPSNGRRGLATLTDLSADVAINPHLSLSGYYGSAAGRSVTDAIYAPGGAQFGYVEVLVRF